jgi:NMD protein affecting ribosome stability and mRNA decay
MIRQKVCKNCGKSIIGVETKTKTEICVICGGTEFQEVELPETLRCRYCGKMSKTKEILKVWRRVPFLDVHNKTYYCGCIGWD